MFYGRKNELSFLNNSYQSIGGQLVVLYGRRRTGKTALLLEFAKGKNAVYFSCAECTKERQLSAFSSLLQAKTANGRQTFSVLRQAKEYSDWGDALGHISEIPAKGKKLLILDEFPRILKSCPSFLASLKKLWEDRLKYENVMLVLCGSAVSLIEEELSYERSALSHCVTGALKLKPMDFYDAKLFFPKWKNEDCLAAYAVAGGIPYYLSCFDPALTPEQNIRTGILSKDGVLYREPEHLLRQDLRETAVYNTVLEAVALGNTKLGQIYKKTGIEKNKLTVYLKNLADLGIIDREYPVYDGLREPVYVQHGLYQIADPFLRFWYAAVFPNYSALEEGLADDVYEHAVKKMLATCAADLFPAICREYLERRNEKGKLPFPSSVIGRFWTREEEFPIMATDEHNKNYLVAECYAGERTVTLPYLNRTIAKFKTKKKGAQAYYYCLFSLPGFASEVRQPALRQGIELISGADIFAAF